MDTPSSPAPTPVSNGSIGGMSSRTYATLMHVSAFAGFIIPTASIIAPLVMWILKKDEDSFVNENGKYILNFQISTVIYALVALILCFVLIGVPLLFLIGIGNFTCIIIGALKANQGIAWKYPLAIPFFR